MLEKYEYLLGKSKPEIISILGEEFNFYPASQWTYVINRSWWGKKTVLYLVFYNDLVVDLKIR
ncbi:MULTISPECIES: hypothetical protein [Chryseobacterium]|uniref:Uncharacterized protein n=1 Tax=Chryseobacterium taihuense TaxID=1141221 RepID=A0A4U8WHE3_9FLAO|nr:MULTISPECIES: hypothetical protein [Chryseobacterium]QQV02253.1 hypothetical protein I6I61_14455 [Chryseobacterium sp. FDAARGOS 1104]VFB04505.1 Uncharacterised protein [Chryseobacterium taihuense]